MEPTVIERASQRSRAETGESASLFDGLFDDAALFPPGNAPMTIAVPAHYDTRRYLGDMVGPFVVPAARLSEVTDCLNDADGPLRVSVIVGVGGLETVVGRIRTDSRLELAAVELPVVPDGMAAATAVRALDASLPRQVPAAVELPRDNQRDAVLDMLASTAYRAKLRTGGTRAELFPSPAELASTLHACIARGVSFKCTAGLHHALPNVDATTGFAHHGFLNVLLATEALGRGGTVVQAKQWLECTHAADLTTCLEAWDAGNRRRARSYFISFGTCSIAEPLADLRSLDLLPDRSG